MKRLTLAGAIAPLLLSLPLAAQTPAAPVASPSADQSRAVDAEVRVAMFDLLADRPLAALSRLGFLRAAPDQVVTSAGAGMYGPSDLQFLLAESYLRLGMRDAFRGIASQMVETTDSRYAPVLRLQLMVDAYRRGEYADASRLAEGAAGIDRGLAGLVGGLAYYRAGNYGAARTAFDAAGQTAGIYAGYARYMSALTVMAGDTAQAQAALAAMQSLSQDALGEFADQVNLTVAQLAYERGQYDVAAAAAARVQPGSGLSAMATLTRGWALYKGNQLDQSAAAFRDFATRFPNLPQRDEARLMVGQIMLQQGQTDEAGRYFQQIADSLSVEIAGLRERGAAAVQEAARAFVTARAASLLFLTDPAEGKSLALNDNLGMDLATIATAMGQAGPVTPPERLRPELISLADVQPRLDSVTPTTSLTLSRRVVYVSDRAGVDRADFVRRSQALREADVAVALARYRLAEQLDAHNAKLALIEALQRVMGQALARLDTMGTQLTQARDSLGRVADASAATRQRLEELLRLEAQAVQQSAMENLRRSDSLRTSVGSVLSPDDSSVMAIEAQTAATYRAMSDAVLGGLDRAFANHPVTRMQDTVRAHLTESQSLLDQTRTTIASTNDQLAGELARLRTTQEARSAAARAAVTAAETRRGQAESQLIAAVESELRARADQLLSLVRRDAEAAEYGAASASFFKAVGTDSASNGPASGSGSGGGGGSSDAPRQSRP